MDMFYVLFIVILTFEHLDCGKIRKTQNHAQNQREARYADCGNCQSSPPTSHKKSTEKGSNIAQKAAQEAKAASDAQNIAGQQAARQVKTELAQKAVQAAKAAEAVLSGKEIIVKQLQEEVKEAQSVVQEETASLQQVQANVNAAVQAARQSQDQLRTLTHALRTARANAASAQAAASGAHRTFEEKEELLEAARRRAAELAGQLGAARRELANTNRAAARANAAAHEATANAARNRRRLENERRARAARRFKQFSVPLQYERIANSRYSKRYKNLITPAIPDYLKGRKQKTNQSLLARFGGGNEEEVSKFWKAEEDKRCRLCGREEEDLDHWRQRCTAVNRDSRSTEGILKEDGAGERWLQQLQKALKRKEAEREGKEPQPEDCK